MKLDPFDGPGSTPLRRSFWNQARQSVLELQKVAGRNVTVDEHPGKGTVINVNDRSRQQTIIGGTGACCFNDGTCADPVTESECTAAGGFFRGAGTHCFNLDCGVACCYADDFATCIFQTRQQCIDSGGLPQDFGTTCIPNPCPFPMGACCNADHSCSENVTHFNCSAHGGAYQGNGTHCADADCTHLGACCVGTTCSITNPSDCHGTYRGDDTTCDPNPCLGGCPPDCPSCAFIHGGICYRAKTITSSGTGHCGTCDGSYSISSALTCSGGTVTGVFMGGGTQGPFGDVFTWSLDPAHAWHGAYNSGATNDPLIPIRCFEFSDIACACPGGIENCLDSCSGSGSSGECSSSWSITVEYSDPC